MKLLFDTHVLLWWLNDDARLHGTARLAIADRNNEVLVSVVSLWEIVIEIRIGTLEADLKETLRSMENGGLGLLPIEPQHLMELAALPSFHRDPFDHLLIAQTVSEQAILVSADAALSPYPVKVMRAWGPAP